MIWSSRGIRRGFQVFDCSCSEFVARQRCIAAAVAWEAATQRIALPGAGAWAGVVYLGVLPSIAALALLAYGIRHVGPVQAGLFTHLVPVFAALLATIFLDETLHVFHAAGFALVAGGAILGCVRPERDGADPSLPLAAGAVSGWCERVGCVVRMVNPTGLLGRQGDRAAG